MAWVLDPKHLILILNEANTIAGTKQERNETDSHIGIIKKSDKHSHIISDIHDNHLSCRCSRL